MSTPEDFPQPFFIPPLIPVTFRGTTIGIPRRKNFSGGVDSVLFYIKKAFPLVEQTTDEAVVVDAKIPGMEKPVQIIPDLWTDIWSKVIEVAVRIPLTDEEKRWRRVTSIAITRVCVKAPAGQLYDFKVNLHCATAFDLKRLMQDKVGVPPEQQILVYDFVSYPEDLYGHEVPEDDVLINCHVDDRKCFQFAMKLRPKDSTTGWSVALRSKR